MKRSYSYSMSPRQWIAASLLHWTGIKLPPLYRIMSSLCTFACFAAVAALLYAACSRRNVPASTVEYASIAILGALVVAQLSVLYARRAILRRGTFMMLPRTIHVDDDGITQESEVSRTFHSWAAYPRAEIKGDFVFLHLDGLNFHAIPLSAFESREEAAQLVALAGRPRNPQAAAAAAHDALPSTPTEAPVSAPALSSRWRAGARDFAIDALRLAFFRPLAENRPSASWIAFLGLVLVDIAIPALGAFASVGLNGEWSWYSAQSSLFHVPLLLAAAILAAAVLRRPDQVPRLLVAGVLISIVVDALWTIATVLHPSLMMTAMTTALGWVPSGWLALALAAHACRAVEPGLRRLVIVAAAIGVIAFPLANTYRDRAFWHEPYDPSAEGEGPGRLSPASEAPFYKQPALLAQELRSVRPGPAGRINVFFIGMAGYGEQDVFAKEVQSVAAIFRERFGSDGRTIRLINSNKTLLDVPIASATSLRAALRRMGEVMDKDRDVLVLYMTSHGSRDFHFSLSLGPFDFQTIDPAVVREALDESGIRNRVVIISACYSGGFVKALEGPDTLVMTASAPDRTSFGCSNDADWTYFGKAYFDEALRHTHSFVDAFAQAKPRIAQREAEAKADASNPQISAGANIVRMLAQLTDELDGHFQNVALATGSIAAVQAPDPYAEYVELMYSSDYLDELRQACEANMRLNGPEEGVAKYPGMFGGADKSRRHWYRITSAWARYGHELCSTTLDPHQVRTIYARKVHALMTQQDLAPALAFLHTQGGERWIQLEREASRQQQVEMVRQQAEVSSKLYRRYSDELETIKADYLKARK
ncbi:MAG TPA: C13 family peptidase [Usitatibacter sp.]|jgi:hypothetical protein|nr:C13 family peptidase [Usitatibacter sp.]